MGPKTLLQVLQPLKKMCGKYLDPRLIAGLQNSDDAAVYKLTNDLALVFTVDFITPIVDDPYDYGAIAASNALSDVFAMGGEALLALNISCFPDDLPRDDLSAILLGGAEKVYEAGGILAGGHTIKDTEPKYGLAVIGTVHPDAVLKKSGAKPRDQLLLTKPLGNGVILTAQKAGNAQPAYHRAVCESMKRLNRAASEIFRQKQVHALTDVTGFSLLGNACEMSEKGGVKMHLSFNQLPFLDGASGYARESYFPGGTYNNQLHFKKHVAFHGDIPEEMQLLLFTPETSGGLLAAVDPEDTDALLSEFKKRNEPCWIIGHVSEGEGIEVI